MRSGTNSLLTMLLTAIPLLAVPALAIFGIPQFAPMSASPHSEYEERMLLEEDSHDSDDVIAEIDPWADRDATARSLPRNRRIRNDEPFSRVGSRSHREAAPSDDDIPVAVLGEPEGNASSRISFEAEGSSDVADVEEFMANTPDVSSSRSVAAPMQNRISNERSWKSAVQELNRLGIRNYRLEPGSKRETFLFRCVLNSPGTPQVVRQFEAEADEPLDAVADVIRQARDHVRASLGN
ncbi:MAG: hypothetical protein O2955_03905 [Planctomycetota bacterium]|nr:hypothetical protein [Planctomycetota bacterium]MDA1211633.1 hypothetical protein [Planctomycetota bacterium]